MRSSILLFLAFSVACQTTGPVLRSVPVDDPGQLDLLVARYYTATTAVALRGAVQSSLLLAPESALSLEVAAGLAQLEGDNGRVLDALFRAAHDLSNADIALHLEVTRGHLRSEAQLEQMSQVLEQIAQQHPNPSVVAQALDGLRDIRFRRGQLVPPSEAQDTARRLVLPLAIVGPWDNEQGKGFDEPFPPEEEIDLDATLEGSLIPMRWRLDVPTSFYGPDYDLGALVSPERWSVAYGAVGVQVEETGAYELRVRSSAPFKIWVDGQLLFSVRVVDADRFDQFVLPVGLPKGGHRILIKYGQNQGRWVTSVSMTAGAGLIADRLRVAAPDVAVSSPASVKPLDPSGVIQDQMQHLDPLSPRSQYLYALWLRLSGLSELALGAADSFVEAYPGSIVGRLLLAETLLARNEGGRANDVLRSLNEQVGDLFPSIRLRWARLLESDGLRKEARETYVAAEMAHPKFAELPLGLAQHFEAEGWTEDRCRAVVRALVAEPGWIEGKIQLARCREDQGYHEKADALFEAVLDDAPLELRALVERTKLATEDQRLEAAFSWAKQTAEASPGHPWPRLQMAELARRLGRRADAEQALDEAIAHNPGLAQAFGLKGRIAYEAGETQVAVADWKEALLRSPENEQLLSRLSFLVPEADRAPWERDIPDIDRLTRAVASRASIAVQQGANVVVLLDHEVTRVAQDGSSQNVTTEVIHAVNETGQDELAQVPIRKDGKLRILHAYAIDPSGQRVQVSSIRGRQARFRGLTVGSTVVLQYQVDAAGPAYLSKHFARGFWFQAPSRQIQESEWVVWLPTGTESHEYVNGDVMRTSELRGDSVRTSWRAENVAPLLQEPYMPPVSEVAQGMVMSTVPDWGTYLEWEKALLHDAFRESAEVRSLAARILSEVDGTQAKVERIHRYVMEEIRYQQDYEDNIAGVRPHAATVVAKRAYGDCKDKAVLFITLARLAGIKAEYALVKTRDFGPVHKDVPMQQFNHAIVFVPGQPGFPEGRFYDPTADGLDVDVIRKDDPGTLALVLDPESGAHQWREIPYQAPSANSQIFRTHLKLTKDGSASGLFEVQARGYYGSSFRRLARNEQQLGQSVQLLASYLMPGSTAASIEGVDVTDLTRPARVTSHVEVPVLFRKEGSQLRGALPRIWRPENFFSLADRRYDLVLGTPSELEWRMKLELPEGAQVLRLPSGNVIRDKCVEFERQVTRKDSVVEAVQRLVTRCERIPLADYTAYRKRAQDMMQFFAEELVVEMPASKK
jgi:transglutaminase-like putative cysteine protease/tetratricopeptide (TPR) repeat protein